MYALTTVKFMGLIQIITSYIHKRVYVFFVCPFCLHLYVSFLCLHINIYISKYIQICICHITKLCSVYSFNKFLYIIIRVLMMHYLLFQDTLLTTTVKMTYNRFKSECSFFDPKSNKYLLYPSIDDSSSVSLSVIVPAYNEEKRCKLK